MKESLSEILGCWNRVLDCVVCERQRCVSHEKEGLDVSRADLIFLFDLFEFGVGRDKQEVMVMSLI